MSDQLNNAVLAAMRDSCVKDSCDVYTYCLIPDHLHLLASPRLAGSSVLTFADRCKGRATRASWAAGWQGRLWQPRYYDHLVREGEDLLRIAAYIVANPARRGLVARPEDWPWSGELSPLPLP
jgi:putative transposase